MKFKIHHFSNCGYVRVCVCVQCWVNGNNVGMIQTNVVCLFVCFFIFIVSLAILVCFLAVKLSSWTANFIFVDNFQSCACSISVSAFMIFIPPFSFLTASILFSSFFFETTPTFSFYFRIFLISLFSLPLSLTHICIHTLSHTPSYTHMHTAFCMATGPNKETKEGSLCYTSQPTL